MTEQNYKGKRILVHANGKIFVNGNDTRLKQWGCGNRYSNLSGQEDKSIKGKGLIKTLYLKGFVPPPGCFCLKVIKILNLRIFIFIG